MQIIDTKRLANTGAVYLAKVQISKQILTN